MYKTRLLALIGLTVFAQGAMASTIWLKDRQDQVCYNTGSSNPGGVIGYGGINRDGTGFTMTISNPAATKPTTGDCANIPTTTTNLVFSGGNVVPNIVPITLVKPGTGGANECLDQGRNLSGVTGGASIGTGAGTRTVAFSFAGAAGCSHPNYTVPTYQAPFQRTVFISTGAGPAVRTVYRGSYHIFDQASIPEPGTLSLLLVGAVGLAGLALSRRSRRIMQ